MRDSWIGSGCSIRSSNQNGGFELALCSIWEDQERRTTTLRSMRWDDFDMRIFKNSGNFERDELGGRGGVGVNGGRKDHGFELGPIWDGGEQLSWRPRGKNEIEENVEVGTTDRKKRGTNEWWWAVILDLGSFTRRWLMLDVCALQKSGEGQSMERDEGTRTERTERPPTCLRWRSDRLTDSASSREIPMILKDLVSTASV